MSALTEECEFAAADRRDAEIRAARRARRKRLAEKMSSMSETDSDAGSTLALSPTSPGTPSSFASTPLQPGDPEPVQKRLRWLDTVERDRDERDSVPTVVQFKRRQLRRRLEDMLSAPEDGTRPRGRSGRTRPVFGVPLALVVKRQGGGAIPSVVLEVVKVLLPRISGEQGLEHAEKFVHASEGSDDVERVVGSVNAGDAFVLAEEATDVCVHVLHRFLRDLPHPLLDAGICGRMIALCTVSGDVATVDQWTNATRHAWAAMEQPTRDLFMLVISTLTFVHTYASSSDDRRQLATQFAPAVFRLDGEGASPIISVSSGVAVDILDALLEHSLGTNLLERIEEEMTPECEAADDNVTQPKTSAKAAGGVIAAAGEENEVNDKGAAAVDDAGDVPADQDIVEYEQAIAKLSSQKRQLEAEQQKIVQRSVEMVSKHDTEHEKLKQLTVQKETKQEQLDSITLLHDNLEKQLQSFKKQKAAEHAKLKDENVSLRHEVSTLKAQCAALRAGAVDANASLEDQVAVLEAACAALRADNAGLRARMDAAEVTHKQEVETLARDLEAAERAETLAAQDLNVAEEELDALSEKYTLTKEENVLARKKLHKRKKELAVLETDLREYLLEIEGYKTRIQELEKSESQSTRRNGDDDHEAAEEELQHVLKRTQELELAAKDAENTIIAATERALHAESQLDRLTERLTTMQEARDIEKDARVASLSLQLQDATKALEFSESQLLISQKELTDLQEKLSQSHAENVDLRKQFNRLDDAVQLEPCSGKDELAAARVTTEELDAQVAALEREKTNLQVTLERTCLENEHEIERLAERVAHLEGQLEDASRATQAAESVPDESALDDEIVDAYSLLESRLEVALPSLMKEMEGLESTKAELNDLKAHHKATLAELDTLRAAALTSRAPPSSTPSPLEIALEHERAELVTQRDVLDEELRLVVLDRESLAVERRALERAKRGAQTSALQLEANLRAANDGRTSAEARVQELSARIGRLQDAPDNGPEVSRLRAALQKTEQDAAKTKASLEIKLWQATTEKTKAEASAASITEDLRDLQADYDELMARWRASVQAQVPNAERQQEVSHLREHIVREAMRADMAEREARASEHDRRGLEQRCASMEQQLLQRNTVGAPQVGTPPSSARAGSPPPDFLEILRSIERSRTSVERTLATVKSPAVHSPQRLLHERSHSHSP